MKNVNNEVFLNKISDRIKNGDFDSYLNLPFMSKNLLFANIKSKIKKRVDTGGTPVLSDAEVKECIEDVKEAALMTAAIYIKLGFMTKNDDGTYDFTEKMKLAQRALRMR